MRLAIAITFVSMAAAARLDVYLPPKGPNSINTDLQTPYTPGESGPFVSQSQNYPSQSQNYANKGQSFSTTNQANYVTQGQSFGSQDQNYASQAPNHASQAPNYASQTPNHASQAQILRYENEIDEKGWHYAYETSDGSKAEQDGRIIPGAEPEEGSLAVTGSFSYIGDDGQTYTVTYTADENGYRPSGDHLPTPPPIPDEILKSLQLTATGDEGHYDSQKSSYDADAGY